ncbi:MAG TPA: helix-turn-helix transcriptional regulator [Thermomicrobiales bacterium]|nr:helix-turn-helix transcriptional regulator [Thermomicrobiales bacterium]
MGDVVRRRRLELGWSQEELAARVSDADDEVRQSDISRLELGKVGLPRRARLQRIAAALGMPLGELLARSGWAMAGDFEPGANFQRRGPAAPEAPRDRFAAPSASAAPWLGSPAAVGVAVTRLRLQDAIAEARMTMARSAAALERARAIGDRVSGPTPADAFRTGAAEGGGGA